MVYLISADERSTHNSVRAARVLDASFNAVQSESAYFLLHNTIESADFLLVARLPHIASTVRPAIVQYAGVVLLTTAIAPPNTSTGFTYTWPCSPSPLARPKTRFFGPAQAWPGLVTYGPGLARPGVQAVLGPHPRHVGRHRHGPVPTASPVAAR